MLSLLAVVFNILWNLCLMLPYCMLHVPHVRLFAMAIIDAGPGDFCVL